MNQRFRWLMCAASLVVFGLLGGTAMAAVTGKIVGRVTDQSGSPIAGVAVYVQGRPLGATTDADGRYLILRVPPGEFTVQATLVGYQTVRQEGVTVNVSRTTEVNFQLPEATIEMEAVTITAERPVVNVDVTSSQMSITAAEARELPVATLLDALSFEAGVDVQNKLTISVRGSTPDAVSYQVDGFEQTNPVENRSYTSMNQALVQEVQILTGAFSAEYFARGAVVNVVTRDPGQQPTLTGDVRWAPAQMKHFGVNAYDEDGHDWILYRSFDGLNTENASQRFYNAAGGTTIDSDDPVYYSLPGSDEKGDLAFVGWDALLTTVNTAGYNGSTDPVMLNNIGNWTKAALIEYWDYQHRTHDYGTDGDSDYWVDLAVTTPIPGLANTGVVFGFKDVRESQAYPTVVQNFTDRKFEATFKSSFIQNLKLQVNWSYEEIGACIDGFNTTGSSNAGAHDVQAFFSSDQGSNGGGALYNTYINKHRNIGEGGAVNKYYVAGNTPFDETIWGLGASLTHTPSATSYYTLSYSHLEGDVEARQSGSYLRDQTATHALTNRGADGSTILVSAQAPYGFQASEGTSREGGYADASNSYALTGGGYVSDMSSWSRDWFRLDGFIQANSNHGIKAGAELVLDNYDRDVRRFSRAEGRLGSFSMYEVEPWQVGFYLQDKMEYEGLIANVGVRLDGYNSNDNVLYPNSFASYAFDEGQIPVYEFRRSGYDALMTQLGLEPLPNDYTLNVQGQNLSKDDWPLYQLHQQILSYLPHTGSNTYWKVSPRVGISHPVGTSTKFFFNFGWMYSLPKTGYRYGIGVESLLIGSSGCEVRGLSNPNLDMPRSVKYEVGFEQSLNNMYLFRVKGYSEDTEDLPGTYTATGYDATTQNTVGATMVANNGYSTNRGMEITVRKMSGRFFTGALNLDYRVSSSGSMGFAQVYDNRLNRANAPFAITSGQSQVQPKVNASFAFHTPSDFGMVAGDWHLTVMQAWQRGSTYDYDPNKSGIATELRYVDFWKTDLRLSKDFRFGGRSVSVYMDVTNVFNHKRISISALDATTGGRYESYMRELVELNTQTQAYDAKYRIGDEQFNDEAERRITRDNDWLLYTQTPRYFRFGLSFDL